MTNIKNFNDLTSHLVKRGTRKRVAIVWAADESTQYAAIRALNDGFIDAIFVGCREQLEQLAELKPHADHITYVDTDDKDKAAALAVQMVREGQADVLMKGLINTDNLLRAVLNKETGILPKGNVLTHVTTAEIPGYDHLLFFTDAAVIPCPTREQRIEQVRYVAGLCRAFGVEEPKIALIHCSEKVNEKHFPFTVEYRELVQMCQDGEFGPCIVDGPLDVKTSCNLHSMETKGINSPIHGEADAVIFPDIQAGNVFYKTLTLWAKAETAGILQGPSAPVVTPSRSDSGECKYYSLAVACMA